jgi:hypothetical protein
MDDEAGSCKNWSKISKRVEGSRFTILFFAFLFTFFCVSGSVAKNLAPLQNQKKSSQFGKLIIFIRKKMTHKGENYSVKMQKYYFCNGTVVRTLLVSRDS